RWRLPPDRMEVRQMARRHMALTRGAGGSRPSRLAADAAHRPPASRARRRDRRASADSAVLACAAGRAQVERTEGVRQAMRVISSLIIGSILAAEIVRPGLYQR